MIWRALYARVLVRVDAETAHRLAMALLTLLQRVPGATRLVRARLAPRRPELAVDALGLRFASPLGLAAGFDKDARAPAALGALGFGFVEVGTVTARPQPGNPRPRLIRLPADGALVNRMGFNNDGAEAVAHRLAALRRRGALDGLVVGVNIGRSRATPDGEAVADYVASTRVLAPHADYLVVNVSSPNTPGLRELQATAPLRDLLLAVRGELRGLGLRVPLLVKVAPDLADEDVDAIAGLARDLGLDGIVATNTTVAREGLRSAPDAVAAAGPGGLSGAPLRERSLAVLRRLRARVGEDVVLVAAGGVESAADARERLAAGASLVQAYTAFVLGGPAWPAALNRGLAEGTPSLVEGRAAAGEMPANRVVRLDRAGEA